MAEDTYPEELYIADFDVYEYTDELWSELLESISLEDYLGQRGEESGAYDAEYYGTGEPETEEKEPEDWEWFDK